MPELPEVEVVRRGVETWAAGRSVRRAEVHDPRSLRRHIEGPDHFVESLAGAQLGTPQRRGKFLWIPLNVVEAGGSDPGGSAPGVPAGAALLIHLGMSGQVLIEDSEAPRQKHLKITLSLSGAEPAQLRFVDQRIFGGMQISPLIPASHPSGTVPEAAAHIAPDPLEPAVTAETLFRALRRRRSGLKRALLDQQLLSGVGNIYADEALWLAGLHFARRTETITRAETARLLTAVREVMEAALAAGGTSFDALYVNVNGASGYFDRSLQCYGRQGQPCRRCADAGVETLIRRTPFMGRSSSWCPRCQPRPRQGRW
ncbi:bifunctional DNA-formamidopyrimidine glycosylase/DNA-(apurinic or apyrimidinic site) lyase [Nesterenkonia lacusekhoensis]|uniref:Formamidopyrimidine-DNA glycosylase n=1 Tax=Nesterenkonia lacusekhoensis TaxID=150832 RepID=A0ABS4T374_9MICC|nr:bifunctional DNA-formamidopyrimidine glycosylase/DNA-(apurinic or apyrimidinic site) lyase [Nesterenkonia lacusekhoensis]MBP2318338.1 formamidopyrimidine-DNA glycosylase [Nesterenkonia lacusekhoensis]